MSQRSLKSFFVSDTSQSASETPSSSKEHSTNDILDESESEQEKVQESDSSVQRSAKRPRTVVRKYDNDYLKYGFISVQSNGHDCPLCLVCKVVLANSSMNPTKLHRHLTTKHTDIADKPLEHFKKLKADHFDSTKRMSSFAQTEIAAIESSFIIAHEIAKSKKPYSLAEQFFQPCALGVARIMFGTSSAKKLESISMSHQTVARRVSDMADDVRSQLCSRLRNSVHFSIQFDESTDVGNEAILIGFVRYIHEEKILEDIFLFHSLADRTTGEKIFEAIQAKFEKYGLDMKQVIGLCTDGASAMVGKNVGLAKRMAAVANENFVATHCILHREALAAKNISDELSETLTLAVKIVNNIRANALHTRIFTVICNEMESEHDSLLFHAEVRWLSRGKTLARLFELRHELIAYYERYIEENTEKVDKNKRKKKNTVPLPETVFLENLKNTEWLIDLAYMVDIFGFLNGLNLKIQGRDMNCFDFWNKIDAFKKKLFKWMKETEAKNFTSFETTNGFLAGDQQLTEHIQPIAHNHLDKLIEHFDKYFPNHSDPRISYLWVVDPFLNAKEKNTLTSAEADQLIGKLFSQIYCATRSCELLLSISTELTSDPTKRNLFATVELDTFWLTMENEFGLLSRKAIDKLLLFSTTYLCESAFSAMSIIKTKHRNRLDAENAMFLAVSTIEPNIKKLAKNVFDNVRKFD